MLLKEVTELFNSNEEFRKTLLDPRIGENLKVEILKEIIPESGHKIFINFLEVLIKEKRICLINDILKEYRKVYEAENKTIFIKIIVSQEINSEQIKEITEKYKNLYGAKNVNYKVKIDKEILGGAKVVVGNTIYDGSVKTKLQNMFPNNKKRRQTSVN